MRAFFRQRSALLVTLICVFLFLKNLGITFRQGDPRFKNQAVFIDPVALYKSVAPATTATTAAPITTLHAPATTQPPNTPSSSSSADDTPHPTTTWLPPWGREAEPLSSTECCRVLPYEIDLPDAQDLTERNIAVLIASPPRTSYANRNTSFFTYFPKPDRSFEYNHVTIHGHRLILHQLTSEQQHEVRTQCKIFKHCNEHCISWTSSDQLTIEFSDAPIDYSRCRLDFVNDTVMVHSPWLTDNFFHLHNDNLLATWSYLRHFRLLNSRRTLVQFIGHPTQDRQFYNNSMNGLIFNRVAELKDMQASGQPFCFPRLFWQVGWKIFYPMRDGGTGVSAPLKFKGAAWEYPIWLRRRLDLRPVPARSQRRHYPVHIAWLVRNRDEREIQAQVLPACASAFKKRWGDSVRVEQLTADVLNSRKHPRVLLQKMSTVDILIGAHGAGLANMLYMPSGGMVLEIYLKYGREIEFFERMSWQLNHTYLWLDGYSLPGVGSSDRRDFVDADNIAQLIEARWFSAQRMPRRLPQ